MRLISHCSATPSRSSTSVRTVSPRPSRSAAVARLDPAAATAILPTNTRRVVRALEVVELTGRPYSATMPDRTFRGPTLQLGLRLPREDLDALAARLRTAGLEQREAFTEYLCLLNLVRGLGVAEMVLAVGVLTPP